jgi:putative endopeptidase
MFQADHRERMSFMKRLCLYLAACLAVAAAAPVAAEDLAQAPRYGTWGFDLAARDAAIKPGDDFFGYAEGAAIDAMTIPPDRSRYGAFDQLRELSEARTRAIVEKVADDPRATGEQAKVGAFYRAFMDEKRVEALDHKPLAPELAAVREVKSRQALAELMGASSGTLGFSVFNPYINTDAKAPTRYAVYMTQGGLGLPDRDYYLQESFKEQKAKYEAFAAQILGMIGWADPDASAKAIVALETDIAAASWTKAEQRDDTKTYNPMTVDELAKASPGFDWRPFLKAAGLGEVTRVVVNENTAFPKIAKIFADTPLDTLKAWHAFHLTDNAAPYLSERFDQAHFEMYGKTLSGQPEQRPRWKRGVGLVGGQMGEAVGKIYVTRYFPPDSKAKMEILVAGLREAMKARISKLSWMTDETKAKALEKLAKFHVKIGYPDTWRDYSALTISDQDLYGDVGRAIAFEWRRQVRRLDQPVDKAEWQMTPQTVNAYYSQTENEIVFPAAILQPPFFDPDADMAVNYGAIGGVIGHEMTHGFDDQGRQSDGDGKLADWWTAEDAKQFQARADRLGAQYSAFEPIAGAHVNGQLTMGENIADLGGLLLGLYAYHASLDGKPAPVIDGLTGDERVFLGWAQVWRTKQRDDALRRQIVSDPHSPAKYRVNGVVRNIDAWYAAFGVKPGDALYLDPSQRVRIW